MVLEIRPQAKERAKAKGSQFYTPAKTRKYEESIAALYRAAGGKFYEGSIRIWIMFSYATKDKKKLWNHKTSRPDIDNLLKALFDGLNGIAWKDDAQVVDVQAHKMWTTEDFIEVEIQEARK